MILPVDRFLNSLQTDKLGDATELKAVTDGKSNVYKNSSLFDRIRNTVGK